MLVNDLGIFLNGTVLCRSCHELCVTCDGPNVTHCITCAVVMGSNGVCMRTCGDNGMLLHVH